MDEVKDKFKGLFAKASNAAKLGTSKRFQGHGNRLGTAEEHGAKPKVQGQGTVAQSAAVAASSSRNTAGGRTSTAAHTNSGHHHQQQQQQRSTAPLAAPASSGAQLKPATEFNPFTAVTGSGAALSAHITPPEATPPAAAAAAPTPPAATRRQQQPAPASPAQVASSSSNGSRPSGQQQQQQQRTPVTSAQVEQMQLCLALVASQPAAAKCMQVLSKLLGNLAGAPQEAKFRHIRLGNEKISSAVVQVAGALDFLTAVGFQVHAAEAAAAATSSSSAAAADNNDGGFAVFLDDKDLSLVEEGLLQLQQAALAAQQEAHQHASALQQATDTSSARATAAAAGTAAASSTANSAAAAAAVTTAAAAAGVPAVSMPRETQVLLPAAPDAEVPDWFFERTGAELKAEYTAMVRRRQTGEVLASRAWKEAQLGKQAGPAPTTACVRVRFPEGVCLQGRFHTSEPLTSLFTWVTDSLTDPATTYELIGPDRKPLTPAGRVADAQLVPAVLLNFRPLSQQGQPVDAAGRQLSFVKDELLQQAYAD